MREHTAGPSVQRRAHRLTPRALAFAVLAAIALCLGILAIMVPYNRGIVGDQDGSRVLVETACEAPVVAAWANGARTVDAAGNWVTEPPCQRSAAFRLGLGVTLLIAAAGLGFAARKHSRTAPEGSHAGR